MTWLILTIFFTLTTSFFCSMMEALILSTTIAEIEGLKHAHPKRGEHLESLKMSLEETISTILTLNTIANACGSAIIGALGARLFSEKTLPFMMFGYVMTLLVMCEVLPKSIGISQRISLQPIIAYPLWLLCRSLRPVTYLCNLVVRLFVKEHTESQKSDEEILLLAERGAKRGTLTRSESNIIANALSLDNIRVSEIMTPRTVVTGLKKHATIGEVFKEFPNVPFARIPVYGKNIDDVVGLVRRRDLLKAKANDLDNDLVEKIMHEIHFIPETVTVADALQAFLKAHQQILVVVDEFGATAGVISMEDVMEHLIGREIFEKDDIAVDMRELARSQLQKQNRAPRRPGDPIPAAPAKNERTS